MAELEPMEIADRLAQIPCPDCSGKGEQSGEDGRREPCEICLGLGGLHK